MAILVSCMALQQRERFYEPFYSNGQRTEIQIDTLSDLWSRGGGTFRTILQ
jgi:hypothetical protein